MLLELLRAISVHILCRNIFPVLGLRRLSFSNATLASEPPYHPRSTPTGNAHSWNLVMENFLDSSNYSTKVQNTGMTNTDQLREEQAPTGEASRSSGGGGLTPPDRDSCKHTRNRCFTREMLDQRSSLQEGEPTPEEESTGSTKKLPCCK